MMCRTPERSKSAAPGESTIIWIIVGTSRLSVIPCSAIVCSAPAGCEGRHEDVRAADEQPAHP